MSSSTSKSVHAIRIAQKNNILHATKRMNNVRRLDGITRRVIASQLSTARSNSTRNIDCSRNIISRNDGGRRVFSSECANNNAVINSSPFNNNDGTIITTAITAILAAALCQEYKSNTNCDSATQVGIPTTTNPLFQSKPKHEPRNVMLHRMRSTRARHLGEKYTVDWGACLGEGAYAQVFPGRTEKGEKVAIKRILKKYTNSSSFHIETNALLRIYDNGGHPNISGLRDMYEDDDHFYLVMDLVSGGEMFDHLINYGAYSEADASRLIHEIASALTFLHGVGVVHADLKPENMLLCSKKKSDGTIQLIDFGCAVVYQDNFHDYDDADGPLYEEHESQFSKGPIKNKGIFSTGTTAYWPPERFKGAPVDAASDMWSIGIILYIMLVGCHPFDVSGASSDDEIAKRIKKNPIPTYGELTSHLTPSALDLIQKLLEPDPNRRLTAKDMLDHPWVRGETATTSIITDSDKKLSTFNELRHKLEAGIFTILVSQSHKDAVLSEAKVVDDKDDNRKGVNIMKKAFASFDEEGKGYVSKDDLARVLGQVTKTELTSSESGELASLLGDLQEQDGLSLSDFSQNFSRLKHKHYPRGHVIFKAGDDGDAMYFLNAGKVQIETRKGERIAILHSGDFFGEGSLLNEENKRFTTAKCATPVDVIKISRKDFDSYVASSDIAKQELKIKWKARSLKYAKTLIRLQKNLELRTFKKGEAVYEEGDIGKSMFFVRELDGGELDVTHDGVKVHSYSGGDSFGESSLLFSKPRSSTVTCVSDTCNLNEMQGTDFLALVQSTPEAAASLLDMCRKRYFKKAVKKINREKQRSFDENDLVAAFNDADTSGDGILSLEEIRNLMHKMDPNFPENEIVALIKFLDVDETGGVSLDEFKRMFRVFEHMEEKIKI